MKTLLWESFVPAAKIEAVKCALEDTFGTRYLDEITPLVGGRSSALVYKIVVNKKSYVLRLVMHVDALTDPHRHFWAMSAAAQAGIAPPVRYTNAKEAISIVDFIQHTPLCSTFTSEQDLFRQLATSIKEVHGLPLFPRLINFLDGVDGFIERFRSSNLLPTSATEEHFHYYAEVQRVYPRHETDLVSSHNDLNPGNVLHRDGKIWLIDWEVAFANDRYVDLAVANIFFGSGETGEETLLDTYFGAALTDANRARFFLMRQVCFMYVAMLFMSFIAGSRESATVFDSDMATISLREFHGRLRSGEIAMTTPKEQLLYAKVMLNESLAQMKTSRFREAICCVDTGTN